MRIEIAYNTRALYLDGQRVLMFHSYKLRNHSPDGFSWGYGGSGPSQLALAICLEASDEKTALEHYRAFTLEHVANWPGTEDVDVTIDVKAWIAKRRGW